MTTSQYIESKTNVRGEEGFGGKSVKAIKDRLISLRVVGNSDRGGEKGEKKQKID